MQNRNNKYINHFIIKSTYSDLENVRNFILSEALSFGFDENESYKISLAVDEACSNLIRYSYKFDKRKKIHIDVEKNNGNFIVRIMDNGKPFNPEDVTPPNMNEYFRNFRRGGLGIHIMRSVMDEIKYYPSGDDNTHNILQLKKIRH